MINAGTLSRTTLAFHEGLSNWMPVAAVLAPRAKPPPYKPKPEQGESSVSSTANNEPTQTPGTAEPTRPRPGVESATLTVAVQDAGTPDFTNRRTSEKSKFADGLSQVKYIGIQTLFPVKAAIADKLWNLIWVRWLVVLSLIPLTAAYMANKGDLSTNQSTFLIGIYVALFWALGLSFVLKPEVVTIKNLLWFGGIPLLLGNVLLVIAGKVSFINAVYSAASSDSFLVRFGAALGISLLNQVLIALPLYLRYVKGSSSAPTKTIAFWGSMAGLLYAFVPVCKALLESQMSFLAASLYGHSQGQNLLGLLSASILMAFLGGIVGFFIAFAARNKHLAVGLVSVGIMATSVLAAVNLAFGSSLIGWVAGLLTLPIFVAHVRTESATQTALADRKVKANTNL